MSDSDKEVMIVQFLRNVKDITLDAKHVTLSKFHDGSWRLAWDSGGSWKEQFYTHDNLDEAAQDFSEISQIDVSKNNIVYIENYGFAPELK